MSHYEFRRFELLDGRKRKPRCCDVRRMAAMQRKQTRRRARMVAAAKRLEAVL